MTATPADPAPARPGGFRREEIGVGGAAQTERLAWLLDTQARQPGVIRLRDWAFERLALRAGETVVDVGSGTGEVVVRLAREVGSGGRAVGVEPNPSMRALAEARSGVIPAVEFVDGSADAIPLDDASVDAVVCERVLQHLTDPEAAVAEMARVLRPGGRVALLDSDWGTSLLYPADHEVLDRYSRGVLTQWPNPFSGRRLRGQVRRAGLDVDPDIGSSALVMPDEMMLGVFTMQGPMLVEAGVVSAEDVASLQADLEAAVTAGEAFMAVTMFAAIGRRPH